LSSTKITLQNLRLSFARPLRVGILSSAVPHPLLC
jgi:hypothetical protein